MDNIFSSFQSLFSDSRISPYLVSHSLMKINLRQILLTTACLILSVASFSQQKFAFVSGKVIDENENSLPNVSVTILGQAKGIATNDSGYFRMKVPADRAFAIIFSYAGDRKSTRLNSSHQ